jgi:hypothetical protein
MERRVAIDDPDDFGALDPIFPIVEKTFPGLPTGITSSTSSPTVSSSTTS